MTKSQPPEIWQASREAVVDCPPFEGDRSTDIAIVGAGYCGLSAAIHLRRRGVEAVVLDAFEPGWGASGRNGGHMVPLLRVDAEQLERTYGRDGVQGLVDMAGDAVDLAFALIDEYDIRCGARRKGAIQAVAAASRLGAVEATAEKLASYGIPIRFLDRNETARLMGTEFYLGGWEHQASGLLEPLEYVRGLARAAAELGADIHGRSQVRSLVRRKGGWVIETDRGRLAADKVLLCTNAYSDDLWPGLKQSIVTLQSVQLATEPLGENVRRTILPFGHGGSENRRISFYFRIDDDGRLLFGGRGTTSDAVPPRMFRYLKDAIRRIFPQIEEPRWAEEWSGRVALTRDEMPHLHELALGLFTGLGYNGRGVVMATMMGRLLAGHALEEGGDGALPLTPLQAIPLHGLRWPIVNTIIAYKRLRDFMD